MPIPDPPFTNARQAAAEWVREEQVRLWGDLDASIRSAANGVWSMGCSDVAARIGSAARIVGPAPWREVPWNLLVGGVYEAVLVAAGVLRDLPTEEEWADMEPRMAPHGGTRESARVRYAATRAAINTAREYAAIRGDDE
jgi:hypothetical protein